MSGHSLVAELTRQLNTYLVEAPQFIMAPPGRPRRSLREHQAIVAAVGDGDAKAAARVMRRHVKATHDAIANWETAD